MNDVNEIIQKFLTQEDTQKRLNELAKESTIRIEDLTSEKKRIQQKLVDAKMKASSTAGNRRIVDEFEQLLSEAKVKSERIKTKFERLTKVMINVKAGMDHLGEKIHQSMGPDCSPRVTTATGLIDTLKQCQKRLAHMMQTNQEANLSVEDQASFEFFAQPADGLLELPEDNIRIPLEQSAEARGSDDDDDGYDDDVLDRRTLKRSSQMLIDKQTRKPRRRKNKSDD